METPNGEEQLNLNFERPSNEELSEKVFGQIIEESKNKRIELEDVNRIIKEILGKNHIDPKVDTDILIPIIGIVIPKYREKIKESKYGKKVENKEPQNEKLPNKDWTRRHEEQTGQWDTE